MSGSARAAVGSVTKLDRATVMASCANSRGSSSALAVKWMRPLPRAATSFRNAASESDSLPSPMTLTVMPSGCERREQPLVLARLLRVRRVREQHDVPRALVGFLDHLRRRDQRGVGEDAAAHRLDPPHLVADPVLLARRGQRADHVRRAVDGDHADLVERPERLDRRARAEIGQIHFRPPVAGRHGHAAGTIQHHRHRERELAMLVLDFHRHRQIRIERRLEVAADAEGPAAAGQQQSAAEVGGETRQSGERLRPDLAGRHVLQDHRAKGQEAGQIVRQRRRRDGLHAQLARRQRAAQIVRAAAGIDQQDRGRRLDAHGAVSEVVLGHAVALRGELQAIARDAGPIDHVAKRQLRRAGLKRPRRSRNLDAVAQQDGLGFDGAVGAHPRGELKRLALVDHARQVERFDGDVRRLAAAEHAEVDRQPARRRLVRRRHHRRRRSTRRPRARSAGPAARAGSGWRPDRSRRPDRCRRGPPPARTRPPHRTPRAAVRCAPRVRT